MMSTVNKKIWKTLKNNHIIILQWYMMIKQGKNGRTCYAHLCATYVDSASILTLTCYVRLWLAGAPWPRPRDRTPPWRWTRRCHRWKRLRWLRGARSIWDVQVNVIRITGHNLRPKRRWHRHIAHVSYVAHFPHYRTRLEADENARGILEVANLLENIMITAYYNDITESYNISPRNLPTSTSKTL